MSKIDALIDLFFKDLPWDQRVARIAECDYQYIETWQGADGAVLKQMGDAGKACGVKLVSIVMNFATAAEVAPIGKDNRQALYRANGSAIRIMRWRPACKQGIVTAGQSIGGKNYQEQRRALVEALRAAGELVAKKGFQLNLEPLNTEVDHPGYFLASPQDGRGHREGNRLGECPAAV